MGIKVLHVDRDFVEIPLLEDGLTAKAVAWPGSGATMGSLHYVSYQAGQSSIAHVHPVSQDIFYIIEGQGEIADLTNNHETAHPLETGSVVIVDPGTVHQVKAHERLVNVGGPCPADLELYRRAGLSWNASGS